MLAGPSGRKVGEVNPFEKMKVQQLTNELWERNLVHGVLDTKNNANTLQKVLKDHLCGTARLPALTFKRPSSTLEDLNLQQYEVSPIEPLHDIKGHIKNVWDVLPEVCMCNMY